MKTRHSQADHIKADLLTGKQVDSVTAFSQHYISAYRTDKPFPHSLGGLMKLDAEGFRLFHQVLHIRHVPGWSDDALFDIEQKINAIRNGGE